MLLYMPLNWEVSQTGESWSGNNIKKHKFLYISFSISVQARMIHILQLTAILKKFSTGKLLACNVSIFPES